MSRRWLRWAHLSSGMPAGAITNDTEQAALLARLLLAGRVDPRELAAALAAWERNMAARGSLDLLGTVFEIAKWFGGSILSFLPARQAIRGGGSQ